jgi:hypothetical protein
MALAWKAGWVHALAGSNPASSATPTRRDADGPPGRSRPKTALVSVLVSVGILATLRIGPQQAPDLCGHSVPDRVRDVLVPGRHRRT